MSQSVHVHRGKHHALHMATIALSGLAPSLYRLSWNTDRFLAGLLLTTLSLDIWSILPLDYIAVLDFDILALYPRWWIFLDYQSPSSVWSVYFAALSYTFHILPTGLFADFQMAVMDRMFCVVMTTYCAGNDDLLCW